jgi:hypothetical protein
MRIGEVTTVVLVGPSKAWLRRVEKGVGRRRKRVLV